VTPARAWVAIVVGSGLVVGSVVWLIVNPDALAVILLAIGVVVVLIAVIRRLERLTLHEMDLPNTPLRVGRPFSMRYRQGFKRATDVSRIQFALVLRETAKFTTTDSKGSHTQTETYDDVAQEFTVAGRRFQTGQTINETCAFQIPANGMHTFNGGDNRIEWYVVSRVEIPGWPDYVSEDQLTVLPELAG
jgi:hypothetical protein